MTKERRLAIQMWEKIKEFLPVWYSNSSLNVSTMVIAYKRQFCTDEKVNWASHCWLCQYVGEHYGKFVRCSQCPLGTCCVNNSPWGIIVRCDSTLKEKLDACDIIIATLKGEVHVKTRRTKKG